MYQSMRKNTPSCAYPQYILHRHRTLTICGQNAYMFIHVPVNSTIASRLHYNVLLLLHLLFKLHPNGKGHGRRGRLHRFPYLHNGICGTWRCNWHSKSDRIAVPEALGYWHLAGLDWLSYQQLGAYKESLESVGGIWAGGTGRRVLGYLVSMGAVYCACYSDCGLCLS